MYEVSDRARPAFEPQMDVKQRGEFSRKAVVVELYNTWGTLVLTVKRAFNLLSSQSEATPK